MNECVIRLDTTGKLFELLEELENHGLRKGIDFEFSYEPPIEAYDENYTYTRIREKQVRFTFKDPANSTWFILRWS